MSTVYFMRPIGKIGPIKIGCSTNPAGRLLALSVWSPFPLEIIGMVPGNFSDERFLHRCFWDLHSHREWFNADEKMALAIDQIVADGSLENFRKTAYAATNVKKNRKATNRSPLALRRMSYGTRIAWAERKLRQKDEEGAWSTPDDVWRIMYQWRGRGGNIPREPSETEIARLEEYLADPAAHSVIPSWKKKRDPICIPVFIQEAEVAA